MKMLVSRSLLLIAGGLILLAVVLATKGAPPKKGSARAESGRASPTENAMSETTAKRDQWETATFGSGCFWCTEAIFSELQGVEKVVSGYSGGQVKNPSYEQVCTGLTGHAEVVQITFDPQVVSFEQLLEVFWHTHDPTTLNRQGADVGTQYRSVIFYHSPEQKATAERAIAAFNAENPNGTPAVTEVLPEQPFYPAEDYHHRYFRQNPEQAYCQAVIAPKMTKLRKYFRKLIRTDEEGR